MNLSEFNCQRPTHKKINKTKQKVKYSGAALKSQRYENGRDGQNPRVLVCQLWLASSRTDANDSCFKRKDGQHLRNSPKVLLWSTHAFVCTLVHSFVFVFFLKTFTSIRHFKEHQALSRLCTSHAAPTLFVKDLVISISICMYTLRGQKPPYFLQL